VVCTRPIENRYWCTFGTGEPAEGVSLSIVCEVNIPIEGINRRVAGAFARDEAGLVCLLHGGKVGGGKARVGKETFLEYFTDGRRVPVRWHDGQETITCCWVSWTTWINWAASRSSSGWSNALRATLPAQYEHWYANA
jgi:hypothetical protein